MVDRSYLTEMQHIVPVPTQDGQSKIDYGLCGSSAPAGGRAVPCWEPAAQEHPAISSATSGSAPDRLREWSMTWESVAAVALFANVGFRTEFGRLSIRCGAW